MPRSFYCSLLDEAQEIENLLYDVYCKLARSAPSSRARRIHRIEMEDSLDHRRINREFRRRYCTFRFF